MKIIVQIRARNRYKNSIAFMVNWFPAHIL
jgi:hypothetical protein